LPSRSSRQRHSRRADQGLGTPGGAEYLDGPAQGTAALDVARAARKFAPAAAGTRVGMYQETAPQPIRVGRV
jgi:hypothetical protein